MPKVFKIDQVYCAINSSSIQIIFCNSYLYVRIEMLVLANEVRGQIESFKPYVGVIQALRNPGMKARHLKELSENVGIEISMGPDVTFKSLLKLDIMEHEEVIKEISESAAKEHAIEEALQRMIAEWDTLSMEVIAYKDTGEIFFLTILDFHCRISHVNWICKR